MGYKLFNNKVMRKEINLKNSQVISIMPNPRARRGSIANAAFPELHHQVAEECIFLYIHLYLCIYLYLRLCQKSLTINGRGAAVLLDFVQMRGGGRPCPNFLSPFHLCVFGQWKESISSKMPIIWTLNCLLYMTHKASILPLLKKNFG